MLRVILKSAMFCACWSLAIGVALMGPTGWAAQTAERNVRPADAERSFLLSSNLKECIRISNLTLTQNGKELEWYEQTGTEERRENLRQRPILKPVDPNGLFSRGREIVARVERGQEMRLALALEKAGLDAAKGELVRRPVVDLYYYMTPGQDREYHAADSGGAYRILIPPRPYCRQVRCQIRSGNERHELILVFMNRRLPVTLQAGARE